MTILNYLKKIQQEDSNLALSDLELLFCDVLKLNKVELIQNFNLNIEEKQIKEIEKLLKRLKKGEPIQYILGYAYFYNLKFRVNKDVLIPRFDTEVLVETILKNEKETNLRIIDLGTGSGIIAIILKKERPNWDVYALDNSKKALDIAIENSKTHSAEIKFINEDMLEHLKSNEYDIIVSNPPYIAFDDKEVEEKVVQNEPKEALFAKDNGLYYYKNILEILKNKPAKIYFEVGHTQADEVIEYSYKKESQIFKDLSGHKRVIYFENNIEK